MRSEELRYRFAMIYKSCMRESNLLPQLTFRRTLDQWMPVLPAGRCPAARKNEAVQHKLYSLK